MQPTHEQWLPVKGYEGIYEVSDQGRIRSLDRVVERGGRLYSLRGKVLKPNYNSRTRYLGVKLFKDKRGTTKTIHPLVLTAFAGPKEPGQDARHLNGDSTDNRAANLAWGSHSENMQDALRHGTFYGASLTHCKRGHPFDEQNTKLTGASRTCRKCVALLSREARVRANPNAKKRAYSPRFDIRVPNRWLTTQEKAS